MSKILLGSRFFNYLNGELSVVKIIGFKNESLARIRVLKKNGKDVVQKTTYNIPIEALEEDYTLLNPDCYISFIIANVNVGPDDDKRTIQDVIVSMHRIDDINGRNTTPYCVCRQNIRNLFSDTIKRHDMDFEVGMTMSIETVPEGIDYNIMTACDGVAKALQVVGYNDDNLEDILQCIKPKDMREFDRTLSILKEEYTNNIPEAYRKEALCSECYRGYCRTLKLLLTHTDFMYDYERGFYITKFPQLDMSKSFKGNGDICNSEVFLATADQIDIIRAAYNIDIYNPCFIKYDKDVELSQIRRNKLLIKDMNNDVYICIYDTKNGSIENNYIPLVGNVNVFNKDHINHIL